MSLEVAVPTVVINTICPKCGEQKGVTVDADRIEAWRSGMVLHSAFPEMGRADRERLISGLCPACWERIMDG